MNHISIKKFGFAFGATSALLYFGCAIIVIIIGHDNTVNLFNSMLHGLDVSSIIRINITPVEEIIGLVETSILGGIIGVCIAFFYNVSFNKKL